MKQESDNITQQLRLTLDLPQSVNHIYGRNKFGSTYLKKEGKSYKERMIEYIHEEVKKQDWIKVENRFLYMDEIIFSNRKGRDSDNFKKLQQDCITESGVVWTDDTWCLPRTQRLLIDKNNPRIELIITPCDFIGIFDNEQQLQGFKANQCLQCNRYKRNCSILKYALDNKIQEEISKDLKCSKFKSHKTKLD
ncbi:RusA family crossover junction endodeoxyribonuclease [Tissierella praeacuta]|uniref:RusA family crossover junction endodeoxyribonuclease n=1 Tax=Tissierella praeacuta TaxID=43131 RepID=UPI003DA3D7EA